MKMDDQKIQLINNLKVCFQTSLKHSQQQLTNEELHKENIYLEKNDIKSLTEKYCSERIVRVGNDCLVSEPLDECGTDKADSLEWKNALDGIMERAALIEDNFVKAGIADILQLQVAAEYKKRKMADSEFDLQTSIKEIEKMDALLKIKIAEEKTAKIHRIQAEEESLGILSNLPCLNVSNGIKNNFEEFMSLLNEEKRSGCGSDRERETDQEVVTEKEKKKMVQQPTTGPRFIERNIQLAKCGCGTLSLTDEEKLRIQNLLVDLEDSEIKNGDKSKASGNCEGSKDEGRTNDDDDLFGFDKNSKLSLDEIDEKLKGFRKEKMLGDCENKLILCEDVKEEEKLESETENLKSAGVPKKKSNCLREIDKLLNCINSVSDEEITPLSQEEIEVLLKKIKRTLGDSMEKEQNDSEIQTEEGNEILKSRPPQEVVADLVSNAKFLMPKFKYRFDNY